MALTPIDIQNKEFARGFRGYTTDEVRKYLEMVSKDYEEIYAENFELRKKIAIMENELKQYRQVETTLQQTLVIAQQTAEDVKKAAHKEADILVKESEQRKNEILAQAKRDFERIAEEIEEIKKRRELIRVQLKSFLQAQLELADSFEKERLI